MGINNFGYFIFGHLYVWQVFTDNSGIHDLQCKDVDIVEIGDVWVFVLYITKCEFVCGFSVHLPFVHLSHPVTIEVHEFDEFQVPIIKRHAVRKLGLDLLRVVLEEGDHAFKVGVLLDVGILQEMVLNLLERQQFRHVFVSAQNALEMLAFNDVFEIPLAAIVSNVVSHKRHVHVLEQSIRLFEEPVVSQHLLCIIFEVICVLSDVRLVFDVDIGEFSHLLGDQLLFGVVPQQGVDSFALHNLVIWV